MPASLNKVFLLGNLTRDPELRHTPKGNAVTTLGLAINERQPDGSGGWKESPVFVDVTLWGSTAEIACKYLRKGRATLVEGRLRLDQWTDQQTGENRRRLQIVGENIQFMPVGTRPKPETPASSPEAPAPADEPEDDGDIPF